MRGACCFGDGTIKVMLNIERAEVPKGKIEKIGLQPILTVSFQNFL